MTKKEKQLICTVCEEIISVCVEERKIADAHIYNRSIDCVELADELSEFEFVVTGLIRNALQVYEFQNRYGKNE